ncbi:uncharacterized protein METZ01_LOCUS181714 [marine metagenome]|uniref:DNA end protector protein n=1 Tax=marine metagenome TaxID=408172 RepID=A0A382CRU4_9ZZZZ
MAQSKYIQAVMKAQGGRPRSTEWYKDKIREFGTPKPLDLIRDGKRAAKPYYGRLNMFTYNPKHRKTLPYYDTFPLVLPLEKYPDGFLGINMHYLPIPIRIRLLDRLVDFSNNTKFDESTRLIVTYDSLKKVRLVKPTIHRYLAGNVMSHFRRIDADEFTVATLLPVQRFKKATAKEVWKESRSMI